MSEQIRTENSREEQAFLEGRRHFQAGRWRESAIEFGAALSANPVSVRALLGRAMARQRLGEHGRALGDLQALLDLQPDSSQARYAVAFSLQAVGNAEEALESLERALELRADFVDALYLRGVLRRRLQRAGAREDFDRVLEIDPSYREAALARGKMYLASERWEDAEADFDRVVRHAGESWTRHRADALHWRAVCRSELGRAEEAIADLSEALSLRPDDAALLTRRALAHQLAGDFDRAAEDFAAARAQRQTQPELLHGRQ